MTLEGTIGRGAGNEVAVWSDVQGEASGRECAPFGGRTKGSLPPRGARALAFGGGFDVSEAAEEPRISCTWCGLLSSPGYCDSCGSPLPAWGVPIEALALAPPAPQTTPISSPPVAAGLSAEDTPLSQPVPLLPVGPREELADPGEAFALVEDPAPLLEVPAGPQRPEPIEPPDPLPPEDPLPPSLSPPMDAVDVSARDEGTASISPPPLDPGEQSPATQSDEVPEAETPQGPRCPSCGRAGRGGLCETCREALRELSALSR